MMPILSNPIMTLRTFFKIYPRANDIARGTKPNLWYPLLYTYGLKGEGKLSRSRADGQTWRHNRTEFQ